MASSDSALIREWLNVFPDCNWAVATGPGSGVTVLDVDGDLGRASLAAIESQHGRTPETLASSTGRESGNHLWFKYPSDREVRSSVGRIGKGLDVRGDGGYAIIPPSVHRNGRAYRWLNRMCPAEIPEWLVDRMAKQGATAPRETLQERSALFEARRNDGLTRYAGALRRRGADLADLERKLLEANARRCHPPLGDNEVLKIAASVARYPVGGPDPLQRAWNASEEEEYLSNEARFLGLCRHLQAERPGLEIALPLKRIAALLGLHWTSISDYRKAAVRRGVLVPVSQYVSQRLAGTYRYAETGAQTKAPSLTRDKLSLTRRGALTNLTSGLVRMPLVREIPSEGANVAAEVPSEDSGPAMMPAASGYKEVSL